MFIIHMKYTLILSLFLLELITTYFSMCLLWGLITVMSIISNALSSIC